MKKVLLSILCAITFTCMTKAESVVAIFGGYNYTGSVTDQVKFSEGNETIDGEELAISDLFTMAFYQSNKAYKTYISTDPACLFWARGTMMELSLKKGVVINKLTIVCTTDSEPVELSDYNGYGTLTTSGKNIIWECTNEKGTTIDFGSDSGKSMQVAYIEFEYTKQSSAIDSVIADSNAPVEYFNLLGAKVANPQKGGIYIRRQGKAVSKVIL